MKFYLRSRADYTPEEFQAPHLSTTSAQKILTQIAQGKPLSAEESGLRNISWIESLWIQILSFFGTTDTTSPYRVTLHALRLMQRVQQDEAMMSDETIRRCIEEVGERASQIEVRDAARQFLNGQDLRQTLLDYSNKHAPRLTPGFWKKWKEPVISLRHPEIFGALPLEQANRECQRGQFKQACIHLTDAMLKLSSSELREEVVKVFRVLIAHRDEMDLFENASLASQWMRYAKKSIPKDTPQMLEAILLVKQLHPEYAIDTKEVRVLMKDHTHTLLREKNYELVKEGAALIQEPKYQAKALLAETQELIENPSADPNQHPFHRLIFGIQQDYRPLDRAFPRLLHFVKDHPSLFSEVKEFFQYYCALCAEGKATMEPFHQIELQRLADELYQKTQLEGRHFHSQEEITHHGKAHLQELEQAALFYELLACVTPSQPEYWFRAGLKYDQLQQIGRGKEPFAFYRHAFQLRPEDPFFYNSVKARSIALHHKAETSSIEEQWKVTFEDEEEISHLEVLNYTDWYHHQRFTRNEDNICPRSHYIP